MRNKTWGFVVLAVATVMVAAGTGAEAQETSGQTQKTQGEAVGAEVVHPAAWNVEREPYTQDDTYGYTLWYPDTAATHDHGGRPALRVALAYGLEPGDIEAEVDGVLADHPDLSLQREKVDVAREHEGVAVGTIPGSTPYTAVYVPVGGRVYEIDVYARDTADEGIDAADRRLLSEVRFEPPSRTVGSLELPEANAPEVLYPSGSEARALDGGRDGKVPNGTAYSTEGEPTATPARATAKGGGEQRIAEGCWRADPSFFVQTQHGYKANSSGGDGMPTGWTRIGLPNFWGQYTHGNLGYGRCDEPDWANDKYAVDYPLQRGDYVFSPFKCGTVTFAGRNRSHADYGNFVSIKSCNDGKYVNLSAHLDAIGVNNGVRLGAGDRVTEKTVIGYAGDSGGGNIAVGRVHLHTAFYRYPKTSYDGGPYGGAGLQVDRNRYVGTAARRKGIKVDSHVYKYDKVSPKSAFCQEDRRCGEKYLVSN